MISEPQLWMLEDSMMDEPSDVMLIPEFKQRVGHDFHDEDLGVRSLRERPEVLNDIATWHRRDRQA